MDKEKNQNPNEKSTNKENIKSTSSWKRYLNKKWVFPAIYLGAAALILAIIFWYQDPGRYTMDNNDLLPDLAENQDGDTVVDGEDSLTVSTPEESFAWPVSTELNFSIAMPFYDDQASDEEKARAVVQYANGNYPNTGVDLTVDGKATFDVMAAASGEVIRADKDLQVGNTVEILHDNNRITVYQSMQELNVAVGDTVNKGDILGKAGRNAFNKDLGVHVHFEIREEGVPVNPVNYLPKLN